MVRAAQPSVGTADHLRPERGDEEWAKRFIHETSAYPRHEIRVVDWPLGIDAVNMAIFDDSVVLLAFTSGAAQQLNGFRIDDPEFVRSSVGHFEQLWSVSGKPGTSGWFTAPRPTPRPSGHG